MERALESTALDITRRALDPATGMFADIPNGRGFDADSGAGFVDAEAALDFALGQL